MNKLAKWFLLILTVLFVGSCGYYIIYTRGIQDTDAPVISFAEEALSMSVWDSRDALLDGVTAQDNRDGDVTASLVVEGISAIRDDHCATVTYAAFDQAGNVAKAERTVQYTDYIGPRFSLSTSLIFRSGVTANLFQYVTASDPVDGDLSDRLKATLTGSENDMSAIGIHEVELRVTNSMGDTARVTIPVEVYNPSDYNATVVLSDYLIYVKAGSTFSPEAYLKSLKTSIREYTLSELYASGGDIDIRSNVQTNTPGTYDVTYTVSYGNYTGYTRLIVLVEE